MNLHLQIDDEGTSFLPFFLSLASSAPQLSPPTANFPLVPSPASIAAGRWVGVVRRRRRRCFRPRKPLYLFVLGPQRDPKSLLLSLI